MTVKATGVTKEKLIETAKYYLSVLSDERNEFLSSLEDQIRDSIGVNEQRAADIDATLIEKEAAIKKLIEEIQQSKSQRDALLLQVKEGREHIDANTKDFQIVYQRLTSEITSNVDKIKNYLD